MTTGWFVVLSVFQFAILKFLSTPSLSVILSSTSSYALIVRLHSPHVRYARAYKYDGYVPVIVILGTVLMRITLLRIMFGPEISLLRGMPGLGML
jgi:hypothetical protein